MSAVAGYFSDVSHRLDDLASTQAAAVDAVATLGAVAIVDGRPIHIFDTGHLISHEFIARTGGLAAYTALSFGATLAQSNEWISSHRSLRDESGMNSTRLLVEWLFEQGTIMPGDPLILSSVSGTNALVVELATTARKNGVSVIAITGVEFSRQLTSNHPSKNRLFEVADEVLDNRVPYGDSAIAIDGFPTPVAAWSGVAGAVLMWAVTAGIVEKCVERGIEPTVFTSYNLPHGGDDYAAARLRYRESGR